MSAIPIDRSPDLHRLRTDGYNIHVTSTGHLIVRDVPYLNAKGEVCWGILACPLDLAGDVTSAPSDHIIKFVGDHPCDAHGARIKGLIHSSGDYDLGDGLRAQHSFSSKRADGKQYVDFHDKITRYIAIIGKYAAAVDPDASARTGRVFEPESEDCPFNYLDTASSRAEINEVTRKLSSDAVAIVGLGGTGSYVLDLVAKTPVRQIHLFDGDPFLSHNAFRAPGAAAIEQLREQIPKVLYFASIYSRMHRGIFPHAEYVTKDNADRLRGMSFVFLCMDAGGPKRAVVESLENFGIAFIDVGMALYAKRNTIGGQLRTVTSVRANRESARRAISFEADDQQNEYDKNIQIADLNALNACLAVIKWKKLCGFYFDQKQERYSCYRLAGNVLLNDDIA